MSSPLHARFASWRSLPRLGFAILMWVAAAGQARAEDAATTPTATNPLITTYAEFWREDLRRETRPIRVEIVVSYYDPAWRNFWGEIDGVQGFIPCRAGFPMTYGDRVLIEGTVLPWRGLEADKVKVTVLERNVARPPLDARGEIADFARFKERIVTLEAIIDKQRIMGPDHLEIDLVAEGHVVHVFHWSENPQMLDVPQGTVVRLTGLYNSKHDPRTDAMEVDLWVSRFEDIIPIGNTASDPRFALPLTPIGDLPRLPPEPNRQAHIAGFVREYLPGVSVTLRDDTGQIIVRNLQTLPLQIGDIVEATGNPFIWSSDWLLRGAIVRRATPEAVNRLTSAPATATAATLRIASQVLELTPADAAAARPIEMYGIITWCSPAADTMILRDSSGGVLVHLNGAADAPPKIRLGVRLTGVTVAGPYAPEIQATRIEYWGAALLPEPRPITLEQAVTGLYQGQRVEMRGHVRDVQTDENWTRLTLGTGTGEFTVRVDHDENARNLTGSIITVHGICQAEANARRQLTGIELWTHSPDEIRVEQTAPTDPFAIGLRPLSSLRQFNPNAAQHRWARVRGVVTHHLPGRLLFMQDGAEGILILSGQKAVLVPGDVVEATGLPGMQDRRVVLREAVYRKIDHTEEPATIVVVQPRVVAEELESRLVRLHGRLINCAADPDAIALAVQANDIVFPAFLPRADGALDLSTLPLGSELTLTGVYEVLRDERGNSTGLRLQLRSAADIVVTATPSWWTPQRLLVVTGALVACIAIVSAWSMALRRRVRAQTAQIRAQLVKEANLEAHNRDIVANASDAIFTTDLAGRFTSFNPAGERMTGFTRDAALGMNLRELLVPDDAAHLAARLDTLRDGDATVTFQSRFRRRDGGSVWVETSLRLRREAGQPSGVLGVVRDVSERKQVEEELRRARDAAEANTQAKSAFLANMSHEIRTPMNAVIGMSNLLLDTRLDEEQREFACTIRNGAESLLTVLNDILDFSRIEAGKLQFEVLDFALAEMVDHTLELLAARAASKQLELCAFIPPDLPDRLRGDPGRLRQVLLNLVGNAVKFTERGEITLTVSLAQRVGDTVTLKFEVRDTGVGIAPGTLEKLFQPFSQADNSMARRFGGAGLGLAISKQIVDLMGGAIGAESDAGRGSTFWFTAPLQLQPADAAPPMDCAAWHGVRVLAVDDHATNRQIMRHHAQAWGLRCDIAADAAEALTQLRAAAQADDPYRVLLSDCHMPGTDGLMLAQQIQTDGALRGLPIILLTSLDRRFSESELAPLGIATVLTKPLRVPELAAALARVLGTGAPGRDAAPRGAERPVADTPLAALRVLVAEDNVTNQRLIALQLGKLGCTVDIANHGIEVLEALERASYDVVFMDCQMPEMDGFEATRRIRQSGRFSRVRIVAMTANAMVGDRQRCLDVGMDEYLSKPVRPDDLKGVLVRAAQSAVTAYS